MIRWGESYFLSRSDSESLFIQVDSELEEVAPRYSGHSNQEDHGLSPAQVKVNETNPLP
jgi:hypothetical protein